MRKRHKTSRKLKSSHQELFEEVVEANVSQHHHLGSFTKFLFISAVFAVHFLIYRKVNTIVEAPYMDEIFHVTQARYYCTNQWHKWDPNITTFPGIYVISVSVLRIRRYIFVKLCHLYSILPTTLSLYLQRVLPDICFESAMCEFSPNTLECSLKDLRGINVFVLSPICAFVIWKLIATLHQSAALHLRILRFLRVLCMPLHFFYVFLYYTDTASTVSVLIMYLLYLKGYMKLSGIAGCFSVFIRQTNIIWTAATAFLGLWSLDPHLVINIFLQSCFFLPFSIQEKIKNFFLITKNHEAQTICTETSHWVHLLSLRFAMDIFHHFIFHVCCLLAFSVFFVYNGFNVVLGHHQFHEPGLHFAQIVYMSAAVLAFSTLHMWIDFFNVMIFHPIACIVKWITTSSRNTDTVKWRFSTKHIQSLLTEITMKVLPRLLSTYKLQFFAFAAFFSIFSIAASIGTYVHPFILADNRHYTFYVWRRILQFWQIRNVLLPLCTSLFLAATPINKHLCSAFNTTLKHSPAHHPHSLKLIRQNQILEVKHLKAMEPLVSAAGTKFVCEAIFWLCCSLTLIPSTLLELRYFILPIMLYLLHQKLDYGVRESSVEKDGFTILSKLQSRDSLAEGVLLILYGAFNYAVLHIFLFAPFLDEDENVSRFMY